METVAGLEATLEQVSHHSQTHNRHNTHQRGPSAQIHAPEWSFRADRHTHQTGHSVQADTHTPEWSLITDTPDWEACPSILIHWLTV
jgi:hypothetical protein